VIGVWGTGEGVALKIGTGVVETKGAREEPWNGAGVL